MSILIKYNSGKYDNIFCSYQFIQHIIENYDYENIVYIKFSSEHNFIKSYIEINNIKYLISLKCIEICYDKIKCINNEIKYLNNLEIIYISRNEIGDTIANKYDVNDNMISNIPKIIKYLTNLRKLRLHDNQYIYKFAKYMNSIKIEEIPEEIKYLKNLEEIEIISSRISKIPVEIKYLISLKKLRIEQSQISTLPMELFKLDKMEFLSFEFNRLEILPDEIGKLINLIELNISKNQIKYLSNEICKLYNLQI